METTSSKRSAFINALAFIVFILSLGLTGCGQNSSASNDKVVRFIMSDAAFNAEVVPILKDEMAKQGYELDWVVVNDIIQPNLMLDEGQADANSFQHEPYFNQFVTDHQLTHVTRGFYTVFGPSGLFSKKYKTLAEVPDGATIGVPVDPANNGRALFMLQEKGLLTLKPSVTVIHASEQDIIDNPHHFKFLDVDQLMLQRTLDDVDVGFLFGATAIKMGFNLDRDPLALESSGSTPYKGIVAIRKDLVGSAKIKALENAYESDAIKAYYRKHYGNGIVFLDNLNHGKVADAR